MATVALRNPIRCFCSFVAKRTDNNTFVCGRYKSGGMVCLFHLHDENQEFYHQPNLFSMSLDCEMCLATTKISSKEYIAPCRLPLIRCHCGDTATFYQSKKDNLNHHSYFFSCPNWKTNKCDFFFWANEYQTIRDVQILSHLMVENETNSGAPCERVPIVENIEITKKDECVVCFSNERSHLITPCNHLCCCATCASQVGHLCPICRGKIGSIQRIFFV